MTSNLSAYNLQLAADEVAGEDNGKIQLSIQYDSTSTLLYIKVVRCAALHIPGIGRVADPYVKLYVSLVT